MATIDDNQFFREVTLRIGSSLEIEQALARTFDYLEPILSIEAISLHYYDPDRAALYTVGSFSRHTGATGPIEEPLFRMDEQTIEKLRREGASVDQDHIVGVYNRPRSDPIYRGFARFHENLGLESFSYLMLRLDIRSDYQGVLLLSARGRDAFTQEHARLIRITEEPVAMAMSNARRYWEIVRLKDQLTDDNRAMHQELEHLSGNQVVGADFGLRQVMELVRQVSPTNSPVLLQGETGTGKGVIANAVHLTSPRRDGPMIRVPCGAIPDTLLDSELFGHEKGAFTGAVQAKRGRFERAAGGTIFLDEIGELTLDAQVKLLRVLDEKQFERLGGARTLSTDVRVIVATNRNLEEMVEDERFRQDLWFRLNVFPIQLPSLRERKEDIPALVQCFMDRKSREMGLPEQPALAPDALDHLLAYDWPGNVRELQNIVERGLILSRGRALEFPHLGLRPPAETPATSGEPVGFPSLDQVAAEHIRRVLGATDGRVQGDDGAARLLGLHPSTLRARMRKLGIPFGRKAQWERL